MRYLALRSLTVFSALVLALPPGWCREVSTVCRSEKPVAKPTCCHRAQSKPIDSKSRSAPLEGRCCCVRDVVAPQKSQAPQADFNLALATIVVDAAPVVGSHSIAETFSSPWPSGPPLRVLQCVWRC
ncbi:MAG TPA: hypothetical protein VHV77_17960 [Pirellulales bacterium]|nr:hypothetical protein [Pirellulales bacterium]